MEMQWIAADDKSKVPAKTEPGKYQFIEALLCILPRQQELDEPYDQGWPWVEMGSVCLHDDGDYSFVMHDDPCWGNYTAYWMPLPECPPEAKDITYEQWENRTKER